MSELTVSNLTCMRSNRTIFKNLSFDCHSGDALFIHGQNGVGKSSLLRILAGLSTPVSGQVTWSGQSIQQLRQTYWQALHYIGHGNGLKNGLTVGEYIKLNCLLLQSTESDVLYHLKLINQKDCLIKFLSAGQKRRLAFTKLFLAERKLWLLDEPFTALDQEMQNIFLEIGQMHLQKGGMIIFSSHTFIPFDNGSKNLRLA